MGTFTAVLLAIVGAFFALMVVTQVMVRAKARALQGKPVPEIPGEIGARIRNSRRSLVYFFSPSCGACRAWTPKFRELSQKNRSVHLIDVSQDASVSRALSVMATPSTIEIDGGKVVGFHVGVVPVEVMQRYA